MPRRMLSIALAALCAFAAVAPPAAAARETTPVACPAPAPRIAAASPPATGGAVAEDPAAAIDEAVRRLTEAGFFSGVVLVARGDRVVLEAGYGLADRACDVPNTPDTTYRIGSITKQFTAAAILQLAEAGKLSVDDPIALHLPDFPRPVGDGAPITIHHLLSHTSGIPDLFRFSRPTRQGAGPATARELAYEIVREHELDFVPGTGWAYSNTGYLLLGLIVEAVAGEPYEAYVRTHLFEPAGMDSSGFEAAGDARPHPALGYRGRGAIAVSGETRMDIAWSAGGIFATVGDLHRWNRALVGGRVLGPASVARMETPVAEGYGYGLAIGEVDGREYVGHFGGIDGFVSADLRFPAEGVAVIVLANQADAGVAIERITEEALEALLPA